MGLAVLVAGCSDSATTPATAPGVITATPAPATTTTTAPAPIAVVTTTVDRLTEVEAIFRDLEFRRLDALYREDERAFRELFSNEAYLEQSLGIFGESEFRGNPKGAPVTVEVTELLVDRDDCLAAVVAEDATSVFGPDAIGERTLVLTLTASGDWGLAYGGSGWLCDGPHPLES